MKLRRSSVFLAVLAACAIHVGSALASGSFVAPADGATVSQNFVASVDTTGDLDASSVHFFQELPGGGAMSLNAVVTDEGAGVFSAPIAIAYDVPDGPLTIDAQIWDSTSHLIETVSRTVNYAADTTGPSVTSMSPAADATVSGTVDLSFAASDAYGVALAEYQVEGDASWTPLTDDGAGSFTASLDTVGAAIPNGDLYLSLHFEDANGNQTDDQVHYVVANPQAPVIRPDTLVAEKSLFRTAETQLEVGDIVTAYNMEADGYPTPAIHYLWNICRGQVCNGVTPGPSGDYTVQPADEGATLTLVATATNASGTDFTTVDFGVIAPAYVEPVVADPTPDPVPAPAPAPVVQAPPAVIPPAVVPPVVVPPVVVTPAQKAIEAAQQLVTRKAEVLVAAEQAKHVADTAVKAAVKKVDDAVNKVAAPKATHAQKQKVVTTVQALVAAKTARAHKQAQAKVETAVGVVSNGKATPKETKQIVATVKKLVVAKSVASAKAGSVKAASKQLAAAKKTLTAKKTASKNP